MTEDTSPFGRRPTPGLCVVGIFTIALLAESPGVRAQSTSPSGANVLQEVVVTAERREESAQSVPFSMQVVAGGELENRGAAGFQDYLNSISSVGYTYAGNGAVQIGIRGVSNVDGTDYGIGVSKSAVGVYLNDVPVQGAGPIPDLSLYDLSRVEVLKGPQGTLYGEGAMGGAIKMLLNPADLSTFATKADFGVSSTADGGTNYDVRGAVNVPIVNDRAALRIAATYTSNSGYIDNIVTGENNIGGTSEDSARAVFDMKLTDRFTSEVIALHERLILHDYPDQAVGLGDLQTNIPDHQRNEQTFDMFALTLKYHLDGADITSSTAYLKNDRGFYLRQPFVGLYDGFALLDFGLSGIPLTDPQGFTQQVNQHAITEELRASSVGSQRFGWTVGAYFSSSEQNAVSYDTLPNYAAYNAEMQAAAADPNSTFNQLLGFLGATPEDAYFASATDVYENIVDEKYKQYALFAETDWKITPQLSLKLGLRWFKEKDSIDQFQQALAIEALDFALAGIPASSQQFAEIDNDGFAPRIGLSYSPGQDSLVYILASKGFRSGGPNFNDGHASVPLEYKSDSLWNYELGAKSTWLDHRLIANVALYYIDWKDIQVSAVDPASGQGYIANAGNAWVKGGELQLEALPSQNWRVGMNLGLLNSKLTSVGPDVVGVQPGVELPRSPKTTGAAFLQYSRPLGNLGTGIARFDYQYVGRQAVRLIQPPPPPADTYYADAYSTGRLQLGLERPKWYSYLYVNNLWNERGVTDKIFYKSYTPEQFNTVIRPRTVGIRIGLNF